MYLDNFSKNYIGFTIYHIGENILNLISCFDGMSCGQIALERAGIHVDNYFASEIDKYAIKITQKNYPNTIQLGDINNWKKWNLPKIDIIIAGSPCQGFSNAGLGLNFDDPRSKLFFVFAEILKFYNPRYFLLENVRMKKEWQDIISNILGVQPVMINSALVSAQSRKRLYWANWKFDQPKDRGIFLKDILISGEAVRDKSYVIDANYYKGGTRKNHDTKEFQKLRESERRCIVKDCIEVGKASDINGFDIVKRIYSSEGKSPTLTNMQGGQRQPKVATGAAIRNQVTKRGVEEQLNIRKDDKSNCVVPSYPNKLNGWYDGTNYRKLFPIECERLQTVPDNYTEGVSNSQRYKMIGNGWTVDVIAHILGYLDYA
jgi:DNA-cytosine methyltransferase